MEVWAGRDPPGGQLRARLERSRARRGKRERLPAKSAERILEWSKKSWKDNTDPACGVRGSQRMS